MAPPHFDDPWLDDEEEQQQPVPKGRKKKGGMQVAAGGVDGVDVQLPLQLGQHLTGDCFGWRKALAYAPLSLSSSLRVTAVLH